jgi:hypothetical protein
MSSEFQPSSRVATWPSIHPTRTRTPPAQTRPRSPAHTWRPSRPWIISTRSASTAVNKHKSLAAVLQMARGRRAGDHSPVAAHLRLPRQARRRRHRRSDAQLGNGEQVVVAGGRWAWSWVSTRRVQLSGAGMQAHGSRSIGWSWTAPWHTLALSPVTQVACPGDPCSGWGLATVGGSHTSSVTGYGGHVWVEFKDW